MKRNVVGMMLAVGAVLVLASAAMADSKVTCGQIQQAIKSGKSEDQVAKDLKVPAARVKECQKQTR